MACECLLKYIWREREECVYVCVWDDDDSTECQKVVKVLRGEREKN